MEALVVSEDLVEWVDPREKKPIAPTAGKAWFASMRAAIGT